MSPQLVTYPTWKEMFGKHPTEAELVEEIRLLDRLHSVWLLARINILLALGRIHSTEKQTVQLQTYLVNLLIGEELFQDLKRRFGSERLEKRQPFHSLQILTLMKMFALEGTKNGGLRPDMDIDAAHRLGRCLIMANDSLFTPRTYGTSGGNGHRLSGNGSPCNFRWDQAWRSTIPRRFIRVLFGVK